MILCVVGPTAVGKTKLSIALAKIYNGEIINCDSVQVYKGLDVGSAKATKEEKENIVHHLLDIVDVTEDYTIYNYQKDCRLKIKEIKDKGKVPIIVGGSGLYLKAALYNYHFASEEEKDQEFSLTNEELYQKIKEYDPQTQIDCHNRRRLVRMYNKILKNAVCEKEDLKILYDDVIFIGLTTDLNVLYSKIDKRVDGMLIDLVDEVHSFYQKGIRSQSLETAIGYKELYAFFDNLQSFKESVNQIKQNSRNYAKRQYTFFKHQLPVVWFNVNYDNFNQTIEEVVNYIDNNSK